MGGNLVVSFVLTAGTFIAWIVWRSRVDPSMKLVRRIFMLAGWTFAVVAISLVVGGISLPTVTAAAVSFGIFVGEIISAIIGATPKPPPDEAPTATALRRHPPS